jgi:hypothetical protein
MVARAPVISIRGPVAASAVSDILVSIVGAKVPAPAEAVNDCR